MLSREELGILEEAERIFRDQGRLIRLPPEKRVIFVGDTHGDAEASGRVLSAYLSADNVIVFLGDYVDRGSDSRGNLLLLLRAKVDEPEGIYLLMGNHEAWPHLPFTPADFWQSLSPGEVELYGRVLSALPFAAHHPAGILGLHGALPDVDKLEEIEGITLGSANWRKITWGDLLDVPGYEVDPGTFGRPAFGRDYFEEVMERLGLKVLVRSHQPFAPRYLFGARCLTIFTSNAYGGTERTVAVLEPGREVRDARDLKLFYI